MKGNFVSKHRFNLQFLDFATLWLPNLCFLFHCFCEFERERLGFASNFQPANVSAALRFNNKMNFSYSWLDRNSKKRWKKLSMLDVFAVPMYVWNLCYRTSSTTPSSLEDNSNVPHIFDIYKEPSYPEVVDKITIGRQRSWSPFLKYILYIYIFNATKVQCFMLISEMKRPFLSCFVY